MEKILLALDRHQINMNAIDFACYLARLTSSELKVIFLDSELQEPASGNKVKSVATDLSTQASVVDKKLVIQPTPDANLQIESACQGRGVRIRVHEEEGEPLSAIISETRFADVMVIDPELSFKSRRESTPTSFVKDVLAHSECPVVIAPYSFNGIDEIVFAYDGSASAAFAVKQFIYLFPELTDLKLTIVQVSDEKNMPLIEKKKLIEFLQMHFSSIGYRIIEGVAKEELFKYLHDKKNQLVIMGAYGRKGIPTLFKQSTADLLLKAVNLPLFVAHKN